MKLRSGLGNAEDEQLEALRRMEMLVDNMFFEGRQKKFPCQRGISVGISSLRKLHAEMKSEGWKFLLTARTNQDVCENFFSQLRTMTGPDNHPDRVEVLNRAKIRLLEKDQDFYLTSRGQSVETDDLDSILEVGTFPTSGMAEGNEDVLDYDEGTGFEQEEEF